MASSGPNKAFAARAAAILTTSEVAATALDLNVAYASRVTVDLRFTLGSLTNATVRFYASVDGTTWIPLNTGAGALTETLTADATRCYALPSLAGWKFFRASIQGSGTVTSSSATITYRYLQQGSQR
jgi:hypothetical protein